MKDAFGRVIDYARISLTDRCNLRCQYCMPEGGILRITREHILTYEEIERLVRILSSLGIKNIRITGGEPLVRDDVTSCAALISRVAGIERVSLTTNGILLDQYAESLKKAGISGINISLDTTDEHLFSEYTRGGNLGAVLRGIEAALDAGFDSVKINTVLLRGLHGNAPSHKKSDDLLCGPALLARDREIAVRFIELMPVGQAAALEPLGAQEAKKRLEAHFGLLEPIDSIQGNGPATYYRARGFTGSIGFIPALGGSYCSTCNRIRITCEGFLKLCLYYPDGLCIRDLLRNGMDDNNIRLLIQKEVLKKPERHLFGAKVVGINKECRNMFSIGG